MKAAPPRTLDGARLGQALRAGIARVAAASDLLNRINVYPVADGDTGTNLAMTLGAVDLALATAPSADAAEILALAADAAIDGARGNSGAIVAEFLQGLADGAAGRDGLDATGLAAAFASAERYARGALAEPVEGTILSVISAVSRSLAANAPAGDLAAPLGAAIVAAREAVAATRDTLPAMRRAGVEDAGARGFLLLMEGFAELASGRETRPLPALAAATAGAPTPGHHRGDETSRFRFCTECLVTGARIDRRRLREDLAALGDSLVLAGGRDRLRVHIHVDEPGVVFEMARRHGAVTGEKADDMRRQARARAGARGVAVVTDSGADLPEALIEALGIHIVPLRVHFADRTYLDKLSLTPAEFLEALAASPHQPRTSQPAPGDFRRAFEFLASHHHHVVAVSLAARVSGTWQAALAAARRSGAADRISVVDSQSVSVGQGLVALHAAECARAGLSAAAVVASAAAAAAATRVFGVVADLRHASRGGRLPRGVRWLATALPLRPVLRIGGGRVGVSGVFVRGRDPVAVLLRQATRGLVRDRRYRFAVAHAGVPGQAQALRAALEAAVPASAGIYLSDIGAAASVHGGPGALAVAVQEYRAPDALGFRP